MRWLVLASAGLAALGTTLAMAAPTWLPPETVVAPSATLPVANQLAMAPDGTAFVLVTHTGTDQVSATIRAPGGALTTQPLSDPSRIASGWSVVADATGNAVAVWTETIDGFIIVRAAVRVSGAAAFGPALSVSGLGLNALEPSVAIRDGLAAIAWTRVEGAASAIQVSIKPPQSTLFTSADTVSPGGTGSVSDPAVAVQPSGGVIVAWRRIKQEPSMPRTRAIQSAVRASNGSISALPDIDTTGSIDVTPAPNLTDLRIAVDAGGQPTLVWRSTPDGVGFTIKASTFDSIGAFGVPTIVSTLGESGIGTATLAVAPDNTAAVVWGSSLGMRASVRSGGGSFGSVQTVAGPIAGAIPNVAFDSTGAAIMTWFLATGTTQTVQSARRPIGGTFGAVTNIAGNGGSATSTIQFLPLVATDGFGNAGIAWTRRIDGPPLTRTIEVSGFDADAPRLGGLSIPTTLSQSQPGQFSVAPVDVWSPVTTQWSFGDGKGATGNSVAHAYVRQGSYAVTITSTDALGNASSATRTVVVTPPPPKATLPRLTGRYTYFFTWTKRTTTLTSFTIRGLSPDARVRVHCTGRRGTCPFRVSRRGAPRRGQVNVLKLLGSKRTFRVGATFEIRVTAKGRVGQVIRFKVRSNKAPLITRLCLTPGASRPSRSCSTGR